MKKVLLVVIDALASRVVVPALDEGRLPLFSALIERGALRPECISIFPSITPAATASIATGVYPCDHQIAGAYWYDRAEDSIFFFGADFWVIVQEGMDKFFNDFLVRLNHGRLQAETLYQRVERHGLVAAAVNSIWFRGETRHAVDVPFLFKMFPGVSFAPQIQGPRVLALGDFAASKLPGSDEKLQAKGGMFRRYGFHDATTAEYLVQLAQADPVPDFTLAYFPNNDYDSHDDGPADSVSTLEKADRRLAEVIDALGGLDRFLEDFAILICGDHSQTDMLQDASARGIDLVQILDEYQLATAGQPWQSDDDVMVCPNMRACQIYVQDRDPAVRDRLIERLLGDPRVDQVFWRKSSWGRAKADDCVSPQKDIFHVMTADRGNLTFRHAQNGEVLGRDAYGNAWHWEGDLACLDATRTNEGEIKYGEYPNAFERIATGFCDRADDLWVTAHRGCEFTIDETVVHPGGSHGALNRDDSTTMLIVAGLPENVVAPESPRTIDVAPLCLQTLGLRDENEALLASRTASRPR